MPIPPLPRNLPAPSDFRLPPRKLGPLVACALPLLVGIGAPLNCSARTAAEIAAEKQKVDKNLAGQQSAPATATPSGGNSARPAISGGPGGGGSPFYSDPDAPMSLLGVVS